MRNALYDLLESCTVQKGCEYTHTSIYDPTASFYIPPDKTEKFYELYKAAVLSNADLYLTEKHRDIGPIVIDLDFRFSYNEGDNIERKYTHEHLLKIVEVYCNILQEYLSDVTDYKIYVMEKPAPVVHKGLLKDGIHIVIPDIVTRPVFQLMLREKVLKDLSHTFTDLPLTNDIKDIVDEAVIERNNWQMYGSKKPHLEQYKVTHIFKYTTQTREVEDENIALDSNNYVELLSIRNKYSETKLKIEKQEDIEKHEALIQERKMRIHFKNSVLSKTRNTKMNYKADDINQAGAPAAPPSVTRANSYNDWIRTGWCLRNIDYRLLDKFKEFSKKSPKFVDGECEKMWDYMRQDGACLGLGTLHLWAKQDNPDMYAEKVQLQLRELIRQSKSGTEYDVARVIEKMYNHQFIYDSKNKLWYAFHNHRWHMTDDGFALKKRLPVQVADEYRKSASFFQMRAAAPDIEPEEKERLDAMCTSLQKVIMNLKKASFQSSVMTEAAMLFNVEKIDDKFDSNTHLIGFENGVYDLDALEFRDGRPEDYITLSTGINYAPYDASSPAYGELYQFLSQILRNENVREYVLRLFASFLHGNIREERFHVWTGSGCFAKDTAVLMYDGTVKAIQDVVVGDKIMGDDSTARNVLQLFRGESDMYEIVPARGDPFVVNGDHDLVLKAGQFLKNRNDRNVPELVWADYEFDNKRRDFVKGIKARQKRFATHDERDAFRNKLVELPTTIMKGDVLKMNMRDYLNLPVTFRGQEFLNIYRASKIEFEEKEVLLDPYMLGYWLGDGNSRMSAITTAEKEVVDYFEEELDKIGCKMTMVDDKIVAKTYYIRKNTDRKGNTRWVKNGMQSALEEYELFQNKNIPQDYKCNSYDIRMKVLAGILDSDGYYQQSSKQYELTLKSEKLIDDVVFLARSLGMACYKKKIKKTCCNNGKVGDYYRIQIVGDNIHEIPTIVPRKKADKRTCPRDPLTLSFKVNKVQDDKFYGFELDGNHLFVLGKCFTIQKNSNGKSKVLELFEKAFGEYCCTLPIALLTQKRGASNSASPELSRAKSKRFACLQEPGENERLNIGLMKEMTGGDKVYSRGLYREGSEWKPQFKMILTCNHLPVVPSDDGGTWRRIRVVRFESRFCEHPDPQKPNEFPINTELSQCFDEWKEPFMSLLVEYYKKVVTIKMKEPEEVLECTREYQRRNDIIMDFLDNAIEKHESGFLSITDAFMEFKSFLKEEGVTDRGMRKADFQSYIEKQYGKSVKKKLLKGWVGYRLRSSISDFNAVDDYD